MEAELWREVLAWIGGDELLQMDGIPKLVLEHVLLSLLPTIVAVAIALPIGLWVGHVGRGGTVAINVANVGRAVPSFGIIILAYILFVGTPYRFMPVYVTLVLMAIPPVLTNTYVGVRQVDPEIREAAEGMGLTGWHILRRVEIPMALPVIMAGVRTSAVQVVATATLAAFIGLGGLGRPIFTGLAISVQTNEQARAIVLVGVVGVAVLAVLTEYGLGLAERRVVPRGLLLRERQQGPPEAAGEDSPEVHEEATAAKAA